MCVIFFLGGGGGGGRVFCVCVCMFFSFPEFHIYNEQLYNFVSIILMAADLKALALSDGWGGHH